MIACADGVPLGIWCNKRVVVIVSRANEFGKNRRPG